MKHIFRILILLVMVASARGATVANPFTTNAISTSTSDYLRLLSTVQETSIMPYPPLLIDSFYHYGTMNTGQDIIISNDCKNAYDSEVSGRWDTWYIMDDGWQGGWTNGVLMPSNAVIANITNLCAYAHTNGVKIILYVEPNPTTSAGIGLSGITSNWVQNAQAWKTWGIDGIKLDMVSGSLDMSAKLDLYRGIAAQIRQGFYPGEAALFTGGWRDPVSFPGASNFFGDQILAGANVVRTCTDNSVAGSEAYWTNLVFNYFTAYERQRAAMRPGHYLCIDHAANFPPGQPQGTNVSRGSITMFAMLGVSMNVPITGTQTGDPTRYANLARSGLQRLSRDRLQAPAYRFCSNAVGSIWIRALADGARAVVFMNAQTNATYVSNITWTALGFPSNQLCTVHDLWTDADATNDYGKFTATVDAESAFAYAIYPGASTNTSVINVSYKSVPIVFNPVSGDSGLVSLSLSSFTGVPMVVYTSSGANNRAEYFVPAEYIKSASQQIIFRASASATCTMFYYSLLGWEVGGSGSFDVQSGNVAMTTSPIYITNTFNTVVGADAYGLRFGITSSATNQLKLESILVKQ